MLLLFIVVVIIIIIITINHVYMTVRYYVRQINLQIYSLIAFSVSHL